MGCFYLQGMLDHRGKLIASLPEGPLDFTHAYTLAASQTQPPIATGDLLLF